MKRLMSFHVLFIVGIVSVLIVSLTASAKAEKAPFLHRHYPASSVLRTSPPPHSALSDRHRPPADRHDRPRYRASRVARVSLVYMLSLLPRHSD